MLNFNNWVTYLFNPELVIKLYYLNIVGVMLMYVVLYLTIAILAIISFIFYTITLTINLITNWLLDNRLKFPCFILRFFSNEAVFILEKTAYMTNWQLLELYKFLYTYKYKEKYYEIIPEEWLPYIGLRGIRRFCAWRKSSWKLWKSRSKHRAIARARIYKIFRKPLKRRARVLYRVLNRGYKIALAVLKQQKPFRVLRRWCIRVSRRWRRLWRWFRRNIKRNLYRLQNYIITTLRTNYKYSISYFKKNNSIVWPIKLEQGHVTLLFLIWSFLIRLLIIWLVFIILL